MVTLRVLKRFPILLASVFFFLLLWGSEFRRRSARHLPLPQPPLLSADLPGCLAIIDGDVTGRERDLEILLSSRGRQNVLNESFYMNATADCASYVYSRGFITEPLSEEERSFPIAYSMVIHEKIEMFERLLRAIYTPQNIYCVHVDQKSKDEFKAAVGAIISCLPNVFLATKLESVVYASWSRVQADLNCMRDLLDSKVKWKYMLNTCGTDFPIKTNREMVQTLKTLKGSNSMESEITTEYKKGRWRYQHRVTDQVIRTDVTKSPPPIKTPMFSGNAYFVVSRAFVQHVLTDAEVHGLLEWEKDTYSPDEHLWATLQRMPRVPGSVPPNNKYDTSDMLALARAVKWSYLAGDVELGAPYRPCTGDYRRAVCVYGAGDIQWLLTQKHLFANKFDPQIDDVAIRCLELYLRMKDLS